MSKKRCFEMNKNEIYFIIREREVIAQIDGDLKKVR